VSSTYSTNLAIELIGTGDQAGTWGVTTNSNLGTLIEQAISGYVTQAVSTGTDTTITIPNGATGVARNMYIELTGTGGTNTNLIVPANKKLYFIFNNSTGAVTVKVSGQTGVSVPTGKKMVLVSNGTDIVNGLNYIADFGTNSFTVTNLSATSATITNLIATSASITTLTNNPTFGAGTANGVLYLNGSKVATSGSALTFDGSTLGSSLLNIGSASSFETNSRVAVKTSAGKFDIAAYGGSSVQLMSSGALAYYTPSSSFDQIWLQGASELMRLTSTSLYTASGINVGIGTSSPSKKLDIRANALGESALVLISNDNTAGTGGSPTVASLEFASSGVAKASIAAAVYGNDWLSFRTGSNTERMRLTTSTLYTDSSINVGIGTSSPSSKLDLVGVMQWQATAGTVLGKLTYTGGEPVVLANTGLGLNFYTNNAFAAKIDSSGNLLIGQTTNTQNYRLVIKGSAGTADDLALNTDGTRSEIQSFNSKPLELNRQGNNVLIGSGGSGNVGIGTASPGAKLHVLGSNFVGIFAGTNANTVYTEYRYNSTTTSGLIGNGSSLLSAAADSDFIVRSEGALKFATNGNNFRAVIDASGNLGIGTTSPADTNSFGRALDIRSSTGAAAYFRDSDDATKYSVAGFFGADSNAYYGSWGTGTGVLFYSAGSERGRFSAGGYFKASNTGTYNGATGTYHEFYQTANSLGLLIRATNASYTDNILIINGDRATTNSTYNLIDAYNGNISGRFIVRDSGNAVNTNGSYGTISDAKMKTDIVDAGSQWDDLKAVRFRKFKMKNDPSGITQLGVVAQELEQTSPGLVDEHADRDAEGNDLGTTTKSVKSSILLMKAAKALQEAMARIELLEADMAALKGAK